MTTRAPRSVLWTVMAMSDPYLDALEQLDQMRDRAFKAEAARDRLANQLLNEVPDSYIQMKARALDAEAAIQRVRDDIERRLALSENPDFGHLVPVETLRGILRTLDGDA